MGAVIAGVSLLTSGYVSAYSAGASTPVLFPPLISPVFVLVGLLDLLLPVVVVIFLFRGHVAFFIFALITAAVLNLSELFLNLIYNSAGVSITDILNGQATTALISSALIFTGAFIGSISSFGRRGR